MSLLGTDEPYVSFPNPWEAQAFISWWYAKEYQSYGSS